MACEHMTFSANVDVNRLTGDDGKVAGYAADIRIQCAECGEDFRFRGSEIGISPNQPMLSVDRLELRAPLEPVSDPVGVAGRFPGFRVTGVVPKAHDA